MTEALELLIGLQNTQGAKAKHDFLLQHKDNENFCRLLWNACHPRRTYKVSEATLDKEWPETRCCFDADNTIFDWCEYLSRCLSLTDDDVASVATWLKDIPANWERELYRQILAKTLRLGVTHKSINKAIPGLFPEWNVQQAYPIEKYPLKEGEWFAVTEKLNGVRCTYHRGQLIARSGEVFSGLEHIRRELEEHPGWVFDGELTLKDKSGLTDNEAFRKATGIINSDGDKTDICFTVFDIVDVGDFDSGDFNDRYSFRRRLMDKLEIKSDHVRVLPCLYQGTDQTVIDLLLACAVDADKEGLMVNRDTPYLKTRNPGILKVKRFYTMDLPIIRVEEGTGKYKGVMGSLVVDYKGNEVGVGTGFTDEQRDWFWAHRDELPGALVEVKYKEISKNKQSGAESLQFPVFVGLRTDKTEVSYG